MGLYGEEHPYTAVADSYLGRLYAWSGRRELAIQRFKMSSGVLSGYQPVLTDRLAAVETWYGRMLDEEASPDAEPMLRSAVARSQEHLEEGNWARAEAEAARAEAEAARAAAEESAAAAVEVKAPEGEPALAESESQE